MSADEDILRPPQNDINPENTLYPAKYINLADGSKMVVRQITREETDKVIPLFYDIVKINRDFYDLVGARILGELLAYTQYRVHDEYVLLGQAHDSGEVLGLVNGYLSFDPKIGISYHTMTFKRGLRVGAHLFVGKMEYHMDYLSNDEVKIVAESHIGFRRWMGELHLEEDFSFEHPLGGVPSYVLRRKNWEEYVKPERCFGTENRPVPDEYLEVVTKNIILPQDVVWQITGIKREQFLKGR
ncbi:MAG: hypothetical protein ACXAC8_09655 [Candidatus Hodarchaeales archaeon]|jgi:hypothetical protein